MKKLILSFTVLLLVIGLSFSVLATGNLWPNWTGEAGHFTIRTNVEKGWNLIPLGYEPGRETDSSEIKKSNIAASYWYINEFNEYVELYPNNRISEELKKRGYDSYWDDNNAEYIMNSAVWLYSNKAGSLEFNSFDSMFSLESGHVKLRQGWNFITITPDVVGQTLDEIKGDCTLEKVYIWNPEDQIWIRLDKFPEPLLGYGIVLKTSNDCQLGKVIIPELPGLPE